MYEQKALHIDLGTGFYRVERIRDASVLGPIDFGFREWRRSRALCFGGGAFMGSVLPGSNRLMFTGESPCWGGFYVSTMGGAALTFEDVGLNYVALTGRAAVPSALILRREGQEEVEIEIVPVEVGALRLRCEGEDREAGWKALERRMWDRYAATFSNPPRVLAVGPAALATDFGAIASSKIDSKGPTHVDCWAGRGGLGSRMAREHNILAVVFGGSHVDRDLDDRKLADRYFEQRYKMRMMIKDAEATRKYRYDPELKTGGTLGVNFTKLKDKVLHFNYRSVEWPKERRLALHAELVSHYLEQFNRETIEKKQFSHCGEPCPAVCKKMNGPYKKDYEPYQTFGPLCGIYDQRAAERAVGFADLMGFDTISAGGVVAWLLELVDDGIVEPSVWQLPGRPKFSPDGFRVTEDSEHNASLVTTLLQGIIERRPGLDLAQGARVLADRLGAQTGKLREVRDRLVVNCSAEQGWMVPNQYWVPGMFSPMPVMGKYYSYYGEDFVPPRELGRMNAGRMVAELMLDNLGFCRFHREWAEELVPTVFREFWELDVDLAAHHRALARRLNAYNRSSFYESQRTVAVLHGFLRRKAEEGTPRPELEAWLRRFDADPREAARDFWYEIRKGVDEALER